MSMEHTVEAHQVLNNALHWRCFAMSDQAARVFVRRMGRCIRPESCLYPVMESQLW